MNPYNKQKKNYLHNINELGAYNNTKSIIISNLIKQIDVLDCENGIKDSYLDIVQNDLYLLAVTLIEYVNNEL